MSDVPFEKLGFKPAPTGNQPVPTLTASALGDSPKVVIMGGTILSALYWVTQRRREVALAESPKRKGKPPSTGSKGKGASHDCAN